MLKTITLRPIVEHPRDFDQLEKIILGVFRKEIYLPLMDELSREPKVLTNAYDPIRENELIRAIKSGRIIFYRGEFKGKLNAKISKLLQDYGAKWDKYTKTYKLSSADLAPELTNAIRLGDYYFERKIDKIDQKLASILPEQLTAAANIKKFFDFTLWKTDGKIQKQLKAITISPKLTAEQADAISVGYTLDIEKYIQDFSIKEIVELREKIKKNVLAGTRYEGLIAEIQQSYGVSQRKATFLARQETSLMMQEFKKTRYVDAGSKSYYWRCFQNVEVTPSHVVRKGHWRLRNTKQYWDKPPVTNQKTGATNHPGCDYNCFCRAEPIITFNDV